MQTHFTACDFCGSRLVAPEDRGIPSFTFLGQTFDACTSCASGVTLDGAVRQLQARYPKIRFPPLAERE